jgi:hypothetical protein
MQRIGIAIACLVTILAAGPAAAQGFEPVAASGEAEQANDQTELSFSAEDTGLQVRIVDGGPGRIPEQACRTPCRFRVPNGNYTLEAGDYAFEVTAHGGLQHWQVEDNTDSILAVGIIGLVLGAAAVGVGTWGLTTQVPLENPDDRYLIASAVATGLGGAMFVGGIVAIALSFGSAELLSFSPTIEESASLSPSLARFGAADRGPTWGLSLALNL